MPHQPATSPRYRAVERFFSRHVQHVWTQAELRSLLSANRSVWKGLGSISFANFLADLNELGVLTEHRISLPHRPYARYATQNATQLEIVQSIAADGYFSHYTAMFLHQLTVQLPRTVYFNVEQRNRGGGGTLTQRGIDLAFRGKGRMTSNKAGLGDRDLVLLNGQNTDRLGVVEVSGTHGAGLSVTNVDRTLIDICVRTAYSGGVSEVAEAFRLAADRLSLNRIVAYLRTLNFTYPYHQAIGYYLDRTGQFTPDQLDTLRQFGLNFDFYLTYGMKDPDYDPRWRLYVPKGSQLTAE